MKNRYINAVTIDLIKDMDYIPLRDMNGRFSFAQGYRTFEKRDITTYNVVELLDADELSPEELETHIISNLKWLRSGAASGRSEAASVIEIFVFSGMIRSDILSVLSRHNYVDSRGRMIMTNVIADISQNRVMMPRGAGYPLNAVEMILNDRMRQNLDDYEILPDIESLVSGENIQDNYTEVTKGSPATYAFIGINAAIWLLGRLLLIISGYDYLTAFGIKFAPLIAAGEYWRLITPMFLHADFAHLAANSFSLYIFGQVVERIFGTRKFIIIYLTAGIVGNIVSFAFTQAPSLGASGAVLGIGGALIYIWRRHPYVFSGRKRQYLTLVFLVFFNVFYGFTTPGIDNFAHIGGAVSGFLASGVTCLRNDCIKRNTRLGFAAGIVFMSLICLAIGFARV
jgi:rhomboid protease GluP